MRNNSKKAVILSLIATIDANCSELVQTLKQLEMVKEALREVLEEGHEAPEDDIGMNQFVHKKGKSKSPAKMSFEAGGNVIKTNDVVEITDRNGQFSGSPCFKGWVEKIGQSMATVKLFKDVDKEKGVRRAFKNIRKADIK